MPKDKKKSWELCDFCENNVVEKDIWFAGDHSPKIGPFNLCKLCFDKQVEFNGNPL